MRPKHKAVKEFTKYVFTENIDTFSALECRISALGSQSSTVVGDALEAFVEGYIATNKLLQAEEIWIVGSIPAEIRKKLNLPADKKGIDGVFRTRSGDLVPYQVKFRSNRSHLSYAEVSPFLGLTERTSDRILFTNTDRIAEDARNRDGMRCVRGSDFDKLSQEELQTIRDWLHNRAIKKPKISKPKPYQDEAIKNIVSTLQDNDRAHAVMACGTGKTLIALWTAEFINPTKILVLVPSLTLLQQTLEEWAKHNNWGDRFNYICVCSDASVDNLREDDIAQIDKMDVSIKVDTDPSIVRNFLNINNNSIKIIFSTYQSAPIVAAALKNSESIDLAIFDEAHKTTGADNKLFGFCLYEKNISIKKRLFLTATPKHYDISHRNKEGDYKIHSMDDIAIYGKRAHTLTFAQAVNSNIICKYKVVISIIDSKEIDAQALAKSITLVEGDKVGSRWVANQLTIERSINKTASNHIITFHSRVSNARIFAGNTHRGINYFLPHFESFHVNGEQKSSERKSIIRQFKNASQAIITNARCLTEGIDVPAVDMVAFIDPRYSKIDIVQAIGRAIRKPKNSNKEYGYIVVPLLLNIQSGETINEVLERSEFSAIADILNAMQEQDEELIEIIRDINNSIGKDGVFNPNRLAEKIEFISPNVDLSKLSSSIFAKIVERLGFSWDIGFGYLQKFYNSEGNCLVPAKYSDGDFNLGNWVQTQRNNLYRISSEKKSKLDSIHFIWNARDHKWDEGFASLLAFKNREGHCLIPKEHLESGFHLGQWASFQRVSREVLSEVRRIKLDSLGFVWDVREAKWEEGFLRLIQFKEYHGHCSVPKDKKLADFNLGNWVDEQRNSIAIMSDNRKARLNEIGFIWKPFDQKWETGFEYLRQYYNKNGDCLVPGDYTYEGYNLGRWVSKQRTNKNISEDRRKLLDDLGFEWRALEAQWSEGLDHLRSFIDREGHCCPKATHKEPCGYRLGGWVVAQRQKMNELSKERIDKLNALNFIWDPLNDRWEKSFSALEAFCIREGHSRIAANHRENDILVGRWLEHQREARLAGDLTLERIERLNNLGISWDPIADAWEQGFNYLLKYFQREGHSNVPQLHKEDDYALGLWLSRQRNSIKKLNNDQKRRLLAVGINIDK